VNPLRPSTTLGIQVREIIISYKVTNNNLEDDFRIQISPAYAVGKMCRR